MGPLLLILAVVAGILLTLVVLIQNPKGGGIDSTFGAANQLGSVQKTNDVVEKATWYLAIAILVISIATTWAMANNGSTTGEEEVIIEQKFDPDYQNRMFTPNE